MSSVSGPLPWGKGQNSPGFHIRPAPKHFSSVKRTSVHFPSVINRFSLPTSPRVWCSSGPSLSDCGRGERCDPMLTKTSGRGIYTRGLPIIGRLPSLCFPLRKTQAQNRRPALKRLSLIYQIVSSDLMCILLISCVYYELLYSTASQNATVFRKFS